MSWPTPRTQRGCRGGVRCEPFLISWSSSGQLVSFFPLVAGGLDLELVGLGLYHDVGWMCVKEGGVWSSEQAKLFEMMSFRVENRSQNQENSSFPLPLFDRPTDMSFALAGNLALDLDTLSVRLVRVDAPFADEFAARREAAVLERALLDRVEALACCLRQGNDAATPPSPRHTLVLPVASDILAVITDCRHAEIVGTILQADAPKAWSVCEAAETAETSEILRAVLPKALERAVVEHLTTTSRWDAFGRAGGLTQIVRIPDGQDSFFPSAKGDVRVVKALQLEAAPVVFWSDAQLCAAGVDQTVCVSNTVLDDPETTTKHETTHAFVFPVVRISTIRLQLSLDDTYVNESDALGAGDENLEDESNGKRLVVFAAPVLQKEALVVSFIHDPPSVYGHTSFESFLEHFALENGLSHGTLAKLVSAAARDIGEDENTGDGEKNEIPARERLCEIQFSDDLVTTRRLWPSCLLLNRFGATEVPKPITVQETQKFVTEIAAGLGGEGNGSLPFGASLKLTLHANDKGDDSSVALFTAHAVSSATVCQRAAELMGTTRTVQKNLFPLVQTNATRMEVTAVELNADEEQGIEKPPKETPGAVATDRRPPRRIAIPNYAKPAGVQIVVASDVAVTISLDDITDSATDSAIPQLATTKETTPVPPKKRRAMTFSNFAPAATAPAPKPTKVAKAAKVANAVSKAVSVPVVPVNPVTQIPQNPELTPLTVSTITQAAVAAEAAESERAMQAEILAFLDAPPVLQGERKEGMEVDDALDTVAQAALADAIDTVAPAALDASVTAPVDAFIGTPVTVDSPNPVPSVDSVKNARFAADAAAMPPPQPVLTTPVKSAPAVTVVSPTTVASPPVMALASPPVTTTSTSHIVPSPPTSTAPPLTSSPISSAPPLTSLPPAKKERKKRAPSASISAYSFFCKATRPTLATGLSAVAQMKELGAMWKTVEQSVKDTYTAEAAKAKKEIQEAEKADEASAEGAATQIDTAAATPESSTPATPAPTPASSEEAALKLAKQDAQKKKRKAINDPDEADSIIRKRFKSDRDALKTLAFLKTREVPVERLNAFLKKNGVKTRVGKVSMKKDELIENTMKVLAAEAQEE